MNKWKEGRDEKKNRYPHLNRIDSNNKLHAREKLTVVQFFLSYVSQFKAAITAFQSEVDLGTPFSKKDYPFLKSASLPGLGTLGIKTSPVAVLWNRNRNFLPYGTGTVNLSKSWNRNRN